MCCRACTAARTESASDKLVRLLFFIGALKDAGAARVTAVTPYLAYARKDRRTKPHDPVITRYVAQMFEAVGTDAVVALDVHNPAAFENAFRIRNVALTAAPLFVDYAKTLSAEKLCVVSPDLGGGKRAELLRQALEAATAKPVGKGFAEKHRSGGVVSGDMFVGEVEGATVLLVDDLISTGGTLLRAARAGAQSGRQKGDRAGDARAVHAGRRRGDRRSGHRPLRRHRQRAAVPARCRIAGQARRFAGRAAAGRSHPPPARRPRAQRPDGVLSKFSSRAASAAAIARYSRARIGHFSGVRGFGSSICAMVSRARKAARWQR